MFWLVFCLEQDGDDGFAAWEVGLADRPDLFQFLEQAVSRGPMDIVGVADFGEAGQDLSLL